MTSTLWRIWASTAFMHYVTTGFRALCHFVTCPSRLFFSHTCLQQKCDVNWVDVATVICALLHSCTLFFVARYKNVPSSSRTGSGHLQQCDASSLGAPCQAVGLGLVCGGRAPDQTQLGRFQVLYARPSWAFSTAVTATQSSTRQKAREHPRHFCL